MFVTVCLYCALSAFIVLCLPVLCSVTTWIFFLHSHVLILCVMLKTIKTGVFSLS